MDAASAEGMAGTDLRREHSAAGGDAARLSRELARARKRLRRVTAQARRYQRALRELRAANQGMTEALPVYVFRKDLDGRFVFCNRRFCEEMGLSVEEVLGKTDFDLYPEALAAKYRSDDQRLVAEGRPFQATEAHPEDGRLKYVEVHKTLVCDDRQRPIGTQGIYWDVTDRQLDRQHVIQSKQNLELARQIQQGLLPAEAPHVPGYDIAGMSYSSEAVGGDYFDFIPLRDGSCVVSIGDASGHGLGPALIVAETDAVVRSVARAVDLGLLPAGGSPNDLLTHLNCILCERMPESRFVTLLLARLYPADRRLVYGNAGHPSGLVLDAGGNVRRELSSTGYPIGAVSEVDFSDASAVALKPGEIVLLNTDGLLEAAGPSGGMFGVEGALGVLRENRHRSACEIVDALYQKAVEHCRPSKPLDDITAVVIKVGENA